MNTISTLAGAIRLAPGVPIPQALQSSRPDWSGRLGRVRPPQDLPTLVSSLFSLCGQAHRLCSQLALHAANPHLFPHQQELPAALQRETALEHVRRIGLDWPRQLAQHSDDAVTARALDALRRCPLLQPTGDPAALWPAMRDWLRDECLQQSPADWLDDWRSTGTDGLLRWSLRSTSWLAVLLRGAREADVRLPLQAANALRPQVDIHSLMAVGVALAQKPGFSIRPQWNGGCAHTGTWSRLHDDVPMPPATAWGLLGSRIAELVRLCLPDVPRSSGQSWLTWGAIATGPGNGLAWVEMARGLLIHQVELDSHGLVSACHVIAPTEWNFHPEGVAAQAVSSLAGSAEQVERSARLVMAALDPCVPFSIQLLEQRQEAQHA
ncbi:hydrogenase formation protein [Thiobacillus sp.]|jgi:hypothetical protein|uniref:hydrogenase formation protein n=1 Tax=Thiobacillus sp. TaxID=924 RepID=UPI0011DA457E|nr:hydrogenase formation protein [Thiobacillus sp.]TXH76871.1 MAG: hydrogenase formation protein [Thiobacillus sp.]